MARELARLSAQRKALGARLREFRHSQGHTQAGLARSMALGRYERTSIAHIEAGSQSAPREFWECADELLDAGGALLAEFDAVEQARVENSRRRVSPTPQS